MSKNKNEIEPCNKRARFCEITINLAFRGMIREETQIIYISSHITGKYKLDNFFYWEIKKKINEPYPYKNSYRFCEAKKIEFFSPTI